MQSVLAYGAYSADTGIGHGYNLAVLFTGGHTYDLVALFKADSAHACGGSAHFTDFGFGKMDSHTVFGTDNQAVASRGFADEGQLVIFVDIYGNYARFADMFKGGKSRSFNGSKPCYHTNEALVRQIFADRQDIYNLLVRHKGHDIDKVDAARGSAALGYFIRFYAVKSAEIGEQQHVIVRRAGKDIFNIIVVTHGKPSESSAAAVLRVVLVGCDTLDIAAHGFGEHAFLFRDKVLDIHFARHGADFGAAVVRKAITQIKRVGLDYIEHTLVRSKNFLTFFNKVQFFL